MSVDRPLSLIVAEAPLAGEGRGAAMGGGAATDWPSAGEADAGTATQAAGDRSRSSAALAGDGRAAALGAAAIAAAATERAAAWEAGAGTGTQAARDQNGNGAALAGDGPGAAMAPAATASAATERPATREAAGRPAAKDSGDRSGTGVAPAGAPRPGDAYVQSFARGLAVLRSFGPEAPAQTLSGAAARSGMTRAGARRILLTLQQLGYVEVEGRLFRLTPRVLELGFAYLGSQPVWRLALPAMAQLAQDLQESCSAAVLDGDDIVCVSRVPANEGVPSGLGVGSRSPASCTAAGRVLLAGLPAPERRARVARMTLAARTALTVTDPARLLALLEAVRQEGHALVHGELEEGVASIAAPVVNRAGRVVAAIEVSAQDRRVFPGQMRERLLPRLLETAAGITTLMRLQD